MAKDEEVKVGPWEKCDTKVEMLNLLNSENTGRIMGILSYPEDGLRRFLYTSTFDRN
jgi:hypothetical protein